MSILTSGSRGTSSHRRVNRVGKGIGLIVRDGAKSDSGVRLIALPQMVVDELQELRKYQIEDRLAVGKLWQGPDCAGGKSTGFIFTGDIGKVLLAARVPGRVVSEMMGHANYSITANIYQHVPDELQRLAADSLDGMLRAVAASG